MTRKTLATVWSALATLGADVSGVASSYDIDEIPDSLNTSELPALLHYDEGSDSEDIAAQRGRTQEVHHVRILAIVAALGQSRIQTKMALCTTLYDAYFPAIMTNTNRLTANWDDCTIASRGPISVYQVANVGYIGFEIMVDVTVYN